MEYHKPVTNLLHKQLIRKVEQNSEKQSDRRCQAYSPDDLVLLLSSFSTALKECHPWKRNYYFLG